MGSLDDSVPEKETVTQTDAAKHKSDRQKRESKHDEDSKNSSPENSSSICRRKKHKSDSPRRDEGRKRRRDDRQYDKGRSGDDKYRYDHDRSRRRDFDSRVAPNRYWDFDKNTSNEDRSKDKRPRKEREEEQEYERYWSEGKNKKNDVFKDGRDADRYLVGSRYYSELKKGKNEGKNSERKDEKEGSPGGRAAPGKKGAEVLTSRTGGAYIPPGKLRLLQASITDKASMAYQRIAWEALKKSIHGHINKVNTSNIGVVARLLFKENIIRGKGLLCRSVIQAQAASPTYTNVYASLAAIINSKFPSIGELLLKRVLVQFKRTFKRNDKAMCIAATMFIAHLVNQKIAHEIVALEILTLLLDNPTEDSVEVAVAFLKECGQRLSEVSTRGSNAIFDMLRNILHEGKLDKRVQYMIEVMFQVRKDEFRSFPSVVEDLDLVDEEDQFTHLITLEEASETQDLLNVFKMDDQYELNENKYKEIRKEILDDDEDDEEEGDDSEGSGSSVEESGSEDEEKKTLIVDNTETNLIALRKTIYLTIQSSLDFEECAHKLLKMEIKPGQEVELCHMLLDCCAEQRTYEKFFGLLAQRFCQINRIYVSPFEQIFKDSYSTVHRLDTNKLRNVAKFFAHLLFTDAISWDVLETVKLNEEDTTSSSRIFIKILFQELSEYMGLASLNARLKDGSLQSAMEGLFPRDNPKNTRFAINFFTSIGLGGLTDELREHLKNQPKPSAVPQLISQLSSSSDSSSSSSSSSDSSSDSSDDSSSTESESSSEDEKKSKKKNQKSKTKQRKERLKGDDSIGEKSSKKKKKLDKNDSKEKEVDLHERGYKCKKKPYGRDQIKEEDKENRKADEETKKKEEERGNIRVEDRELKKWEDKIKAREEDQDRRRREPEEMDNENMKKWEEKIRKREGGRERRREDNGDVKRETEREAKSWEDKMKKREEGQKDQTGETKRNVKTSGNKIKKKEDNQDKRREEDKPLKREEKKWEDKLKLRKEDREKRREEERGTKKEEVREEKRCEEKIKRREEEKDTKRWDERGKRKEEKEKRREGDIEIKRTEEKEKRRLYEKDRRREENREMGMKKGEDREKRK